MNNDIEAIDPVEQCFEHFGILGMKWGRRRSTKELQAARGKKDWEGDSSKNLSADERRYRELSKNRYRKCRLRIFEVGSTDKTRSMITIV